MPITWGERPQNIDTEASPGAATIHYVLAGVPLEPVAYALALGYSPVLYANLYRQNISIHAQGTGVWYIDVTYGPYDKKQPEVGDFSWTFDTTGGTKHITQALEHISDDKAPTIDANKNHNGTIGVNENGDVEGVDVVDYAFKWTEKRQLLLASYGWTYATVLAALTGGVNDASFRGKAVGTVLFEGATGGQSSKEPTLLDITYHFQHSPSATGLTVGAITGVNKKGHEYLWVEYVTEKDVAGKHAIKQAAHAHVEQVYSSVDFSTLGIGTT